MCGWVSGSADLSHPAAAAGVRRCGQHGEVRQRRAGAAVVDECGRPADQLHIRHVEAGCGHEAADFSTVGGEGASVAVLPERHVLGTGHLQQVVGVLRCPHERDHRVVLQVLSHARHVGDDVDVLRAQLVGWTDPREQQ